MAQLNSIYNICVIDVGSPKKGKLGWCFIDIKNDERHTGIAGQNLDELISHIAESTRKNGLILGFEAPLWVPIRRELEHLTDGRGGGEKAWSAGAGPIVLAINLPIMVYLFEGIKSKIPDISYYLNEEGFSAKPKQIMVFEAYVSGESEKDKKARLIEEDIEEDKGSIDIRDARIMAQTCLYYARKNKFPPPKIKREDHDGFFNLAAAALLKCRLLKKIDYLDVYTPVYEPKTINSKPSK